MLKVQSSISYENGIWSEVIDKYSELEGVEREVAHGGSSSLEEQKET